MMTQAHPDPGTRTSFITPLAISAALVAPFIVLQWLNRRTFEEAFPFVLFSFMLLNALLVALLMTPALRRLRPTRRIGALRLRHWAGLVLGGFLLYVYANVVMDQLPCFMGVPNCD